MKPDNSLHIWSRSQKMAATAAILLLMGVVHFVPPELQASPTPDRPNSRQDKAQTLFTPKSAPEGNPLPAPGLNPDADKGRVLRLEPVGLAHWGAIKQGAQVLLPTVTGEILEGVVNLVIEDNGWLRMGGALAHGKGTFALNTRNGQVAGQILLPKEAIGYEIRMDGEEVLLIERRLSGLMGPSALQSEKSPPSGAAFTAVKSSAEESISEAGEPCQRGVFSTTLCTPRLMASLFSRTTALHRSFSRVRSSVLL
ncbi:MAG: hypothetical protein WCL08_04315 [Verrucomicrobiota bacterium]